MSFLKKIDTLYRAVQETYGIPEENTAFSCFINVEPIDCGTKHSFVIKKQEKAKLLVICGKQRVYISDIQIINTILSMDSEDIEWFLQQFVLLYIGVGYPVHFSISGESFIGCGINLYPESKPISLFSDSIIDINDFVFVLNFIFSKDKCWEEMSGQQGFSKRTLCKYISLIDYYANNTLRSKQFLDAIKYPLTSPHPVDSITTKKLFHQTEKFDISLYR